MSTELEDYINKTKPSIDLMDKDQLLYFLNGFSHKLKADITFTYKEMTGEIQRKESYRNLNTSKLKCGNFCEVYRESDVKHAEACQECDKNIALKYYQGNKNTPMLYCCHMGIWDMSYPIYIKNSLIGVIFVGQIIVDEEMSILREKLSSAIGDEFDISSCPTTGNQIDYIISNIKNKAISSKELLIYLLSKENTEDELTLISYDDLLTRFKDFKEFGIMLISLITRLHRSTVLIEQMNLINTISTRLSDVSTSTDMRWDTICDVAKCFRIAAELDNFDIYYRQKSFYIQKIGNKGIIPPEKAKQIPLDMAMVFPVDELVKPYDISEDDEFLTEYDINSQTLIYRSEVTDFENHNISTLLLVSSPVGKTDNNFIQMFCEMLAVRMKVSGIFEQMIKEREVYTKRVRRVTHYTRTMLHNSLSIIHKTWKNKQANSVIREDLDNIEGCIRFAKLEMAELDEPSKAKWEYRDLIPVIDDVINIMASWSVEKTCTIEYQKPSKPVIIYMNPAYIRIAFINLVENALKYSYAKHTIKIYVTVPDKYRVIIKIINFGIGIPEEMLEKIRKEGQRGKIPDLERSNVMRTGSGYGLPIAIDFVEEHNGFLQIKSTPADDNVRKPYHRYVTTVTVTLPITMKGKYHNEL
jgi:signal transduction histidine kinase